MSMLYYTRKENSMSSTGSETTSSTLFPFDVYKRQFTLSEAALVSGTPKKNIQNWLARGKAETRSPESEDKKEQIGEKLERVDRWLFSAYDIIRLAGFGCLGPVLTFTQSLMVAELFAKVYREKYDPDGDNKHLYGDEPVWICLSFENPAHPQHHIIYAAGGYDSPFDELWNEHPDAPKNAPILMIPVDKVIDEIRGGLIRTLDQDHRG